MFRSIFNNFFYFLFGLHTVGGSGRRIRGTRLRFGRAIICGLIKLGRRRRRRLRVIVRRFAPGVGLLAVVVNLYLFFFSSSRGPLTAMIYDHEILDRTA